MVAGNNSRVMLRWRTAHKRLERTAMRAGVGGDWVTEVILRHCEERRDEAIQPLNFALDCFASLAMTLSASPRGRRVRARGWRRAGRGRDRRSRAARRQARGRAAA